MSQQIDQSQVKTLVADLAARALITSIQEQSYVFAVDSGTVNNYIANLTPSATLVQGSLVVFLANNTNTGSSNLTVNSHTVNITKNGTIPLSGGEIVAGQIIPLIYDGTNFQLVSGVIDKPIHLVSAVAGLPNPSQIVMMYTAAFIVAFPSNFSNPQSYGTCGTNPTSSATYTLYKNGSVVATITISPVGNFTFATVSGSSFVINPADRVVLLAPSTQDNTLADVSITLVGTRGSVVSTVDYNKTFTWKGNYDSTYTYSPYDLVYYNGNTYLCTATSLNNDPTNGSYWNLFAEGGPQGPTGATGATGPAGPTGSSGTAATISVGSTTTGAAGTSASVTNSGTSSAAVFNFTIPQGATGATGTTGSAGATGSVGPQGPAGQGFNYRGLWTASTTYNPYDVVSYNGSTYESSTTFTSSTSFNPSNWNLWAASGGYYAVDTGVANALAITLSPAPIISAGLQIDVLIANANTGATTISVNSGTPINITKSGTVALSSGDFKAGQIAPLVFDGTEFQVVGGGGSSITFAGDISGTGLTQEVIGLTNILIDTTTALADGQILQYSSSAGKYERVIDRPIHLVSAVAGQPSAGQIVMMYTAAFAVAFPADFSTPNAYGTVGANPTSTAVYGLYKNGANAGTVSISTSGVFTFSTSGSVLTLNAGDRLTLVAPGAQDNTLSDVSMTFVGTRASSVNPVTYNPIPTWRGTYNNATTYQPYDMVSYLGSSYICILVSTGNLPTNTTYWQLIASQGLTGSQIYNGTVDPTSGLGSNGDFYIESSGTAASGGVAISDVQNETFTYAADTGTANTYVVSLAQSPTALVAGLEVQFKIANTNTGASTLNLNGYGAKNLVKSGSTALAGSDLKAGQIVTAIYDGVNFQLQGVTSSQNLLVASYNPLISANWTTFGSGGTRTNITGILPAAGDAIEIIGKTGTQGIFGVYRSVSAGDFTYDVMVYPAPTASNGNSPRVMVGFTDGTKVQGVCWGWNAAGTPQNYLYITTGQASGLTGISYVGANGQVQTGVQATLSSSMIGGPVPIRLKRTGTTYSAAISLNGGITFTTLYTDTTPYLTANSIAIWADPQGGSDAPRITLISSTLQ